MDELLDGRDTAVDRAGRKDAASRSCRLGARSASANSAREKGIVASPSDAT
jgi:hypothetical protein